MFFPIGDDQIRGGSYPIFTYAFLVINVLVFVFELSLDPADLEAFIKTYSAIPAEIQQGKNLSGLFTSMFLHGGWMHIISNMLFLWVFADNIEATIGNLSFFLFYILGGVVASLCHVYFNLGSPIPSLGASGAIAAVMGAYLVMFPRSQVKVLFFLLIILRKFSIPAVAFLGIWIVMQVVSGVQSMGIAGEGGGTAWWAHIGGFVFGALVGFFLRSRAEQFDFTSD